MSPTSNFGKIYRYEVLQIVGQAENNAVFEVRDPVNGQIANIYRWTPPADALDSSLAKLDGQVSAIQDLGAEIFSAGGSLCLVAGNDDLARTSLERLRSVELFPGSWPNIMAEISEPLAPGPSLPSSAPSPAVNVSPPPPAPAIRTKSPAGKIFMAAFIGALLTAATALIIFVSRTPPRIETFAASMSTIEAGDSIKLTWSVQDSENVRIEPGIGPVNQSGSLDVTPGTDTTYILTATGKWSTSAESRQTVSVKASPLDIAYFRAENAQGKVNLSWEVHGSKQVIVGSDPVTRNGSRLVDPVRPFWLLASAPDGAMLVSVVNLVNWTGETRYGVTTRARRNDKDGLLYIWIEPGSFSMGCSSDTPCSPIEKPAHPVQLTKGFWLGETEVTVRAWKRYVQATGSSMPAESTFGGRSINAGWADEQKPIVNIDWSQAQAFCQWSGGRLPTEAEWEFAARAGSAERYYGDLAQIAWYGDNSGQNTVSTLEINNTDSAHYEQRLAANGNTVHDAAQKAPNRSNLFDMLGNVWEWVADFYDEQYYAQAEVRDPAGPAAGPNHITRGGSWFNTPDEVTASSRRERKPDYHNIDVGFRCAAQ